MNKKCDELYRIAKRDNNKLRNYLLVNPIQGKHMPVDPIRALALFKELSQKVLLKYPNEKFLIIGFAETATAIGATVATECPEGTYYIQTTRENIDNSEYLFFSEVHSHASEQKLIKNSINEILKNIDRVIFVEDEVTTGNTILNIKNILLKEYEEYNLKFGIASILNGMEDEIIENFKTIGIECLYIERIKDREFNKKLEKYSYSKNLKKSLEQEYKENNKIKFFEINVLGEPRKGINAREYYHNCLIFAEKIKENLEVKSDYNKKILILGAEEFMYPGLILGEKLKTELENLEIRFHAITRSPILPSIEENYPLKSRYELRSFYDENRVVYIYNLEKYDQVIIVHDSKTITEFSIKSIVSALEGNDCGNITIIQWSENNENFL